MGTIGPLAMQLTWIRIQPEVKVPVPSLENGGPPTGVGSGRWTFLPR